MGGRVGAAGTPVVLPKVLEAPRPVRNAQQNAVSTQTERRGSAEVPDTFVSKEAAIPLRQRAGDAATRVNDAVSDVRASLGGLVVTEKDANDALRSLQCLRGDELDRAVYELQRGGGLD